MCEEQTNAALGHLHENEAWRQEYLELWSHQRPSPFRVGFDDYDFDSKPFPCHSLMLWPEVGNHATMLTALHLAVVTATFLHQF